MLYYHGRNNDKIIRFYNKKNRKNTALGIGIYTTRNIEQAKQWACKNSKYGVVYVSDIDLSNYPIDIIDYNGNEEDFLYLCYLCRNKTDDIAKETIYNYDKVDIILSPVLSNIYNLYKSIRKLHGSNYSISKNSKKIRKITIKKNNKNNSFKIVSNNIKFHENMEQVFFKSNFAIQIFNENLKEIIYFERKNADIEEVKKCKIKFSKEKQIIEKYDESEAKNERVL